MMKWNETGKFDMHLKRCAEIFSPENAVLLFNDPKEAIEFLSSIKADDLIDEESVFQIII